MTRQKLFERLKEWKLKQLTDDIEIERAEPTIPPTPAVALHGQVKECKDLEDLLNYFLEFESLDIFEFAEIMIKIFWEVK